MNEDNSQGERPVESSNGPSLWSIGNGLWILLIIATAYMWYTGKFEQAAPQNPIEVVKSDDEPKLQEPKLETVTVPEFEFTNQEGEKITKNDLLGKQWIVDFMFTKCAMSCPTLTLAMKKLNDSVKDVDVRFVSITVDPKRDTPAQLKGYAEIYGAESDRWLFLTGKKAQLYDLIKNTFSAEIIENNSPAIGLEFAHSNRFIHIDENGKILGSYNGIVEEDIAVLTRVLKGKIETPEKHKFLRVVREPSKAEAKDGSPYKKKEPGEDVKEFEEDILFLDEEPETNSESGEEEHAAEKHTEDHTENHIDKFTLVPAWVLWLPTVNACLNSLATILLIFGVSLIKKGKESAHKKTMITAFGVSILFLLCYLTYHYLLTYYTGDAHRTYPGTGTIRTVYYVILFTHLPLAMFVPFLAIATIYTGLKDRRVVHKKLAKITFPIWLYVSITGVVIYLMLYQFS